ncbi:MAG: aquaporin [Planctomycetota bacterium]
MSDESDDNKMSLSLWRRCLCEAIGTYVLVLIGCGAMVVNAMTGDLTHAGVAISWGLVVLTMIYAIGDCSGAHLNPAVSIGFATVGRFRWRDTLAYIPAQCTGAILAACSLKVALPPTEAMLGATVTELPWPTAFAIEYMMTAILMWVVMGVSTGAKEKSITAGIAVGSVIAMEAMVAGPLTRASMNPARSIGPAVASLKIDQLPLYIAAPIVGAVVGAWLYRLVRGNDAS